MDHKRSFWFSFIVLLLLVGGMLGTGYYLTKHPVKLAFKQTVLQPGYYQVTEVADGDTITVDMEGKSEKIRFIGVDTPETHDPRKAVQCFGEAASNYTKNIIGGNRVRLEADPLNTNRDRYDRLLRYVYLPDGRLVNAEIVKQGYGFAYLGFPFSKSNEFKAYQQQARQENRGLWSACVPAENQYGGFSSNDAQ